MALHPEVYEGPEALRKLARALLFLIC